MLGAQKSKEGLGSGLSGKAASTVTQQEQLADRMCNQLKQQRQLCWVGEAFRKPKIKLFAMGKTGSILEGPKSI